MRTLFIIPLVLMSLVSFPSWSLTWDDLVYRGELYYQKFTDVPFTGEVEGIWRGSIKNGRMEGHWETYYKNGQLQSKGHFKNGKEEGSWVEYHSNGQLALEGNYVNGKRDSCWYSYNRDGSLDTWWTGRYKNDAKVSTPLNFDNLEDDEWDCSGRTKTRQ